MTDPNKIWSVFHVNTDTGETAPFGDLGPMTRDEAMLRAADIRIGGGRGAAYHDAWTVRALPIADAGNGRPLPR